MREVGVSSMVRFLAHDLQADQNEYTAATARPIMMSQTLSRSPDMAGFKSLGAAEQRAHVRVALLFAAEFEQLRRLKPESLRNHDVRKHFHADVVQIDLIVVELAAVGDGLFEGGDPALQLLESFIGLELRIALGHREQSADARSQLLLGRTDGGYVAGGARLTDRGARAHYFLERILLELHVALTGFHQLRQLVVALFQQHVDVGPRDLDVFAQVHKSVVDPGDVSDQDNCQGQDHDKTDHDSTSSGSLERGQYIIGV